MLAKIFYILDFGCSLGCYTRYFLEQGYNVEMTKGSSELCRLASKYTEIKIRQMFFEELSVTDKYGGILVRPFILHLPMGKLAEVMQKR